MPGAEWTDKLFLITKTLTIHGLCIWTGAAGRNDYLQVMMKMAEKYKKKMWG